MKLKKFLAPLMAAVITASAIPVSTVTAASPRIFVNITYENNERIRADIMFENIEDCCAGNFHVEVGDGWNLAYDNEGKIEFLRNNCNSKEDIVVLEPRSTNDFVLGFFVNGDRNFNGHFGSVYLEKNSNFSPTNAKVNVVFSNGGRFDDFLINQNDDYIIGADSFNVPPMLSANEYIIGDANNDGRVNAIDATWINMATGENNTQSYIVDEIKYTYKNYFPEANCAAAPDATLNGVIDYTDVEAIVQYYVDMSTTGQNNTRIGQREFYEIFDNW